MVKLNAGDIIKCHDKDDLIRVHEGLAKVDIETEFVYEMNGEKGLWLRIEKIN